VNDHNIPRHIAELVAEASNSETYEERLGPIHQLCGSLHANPVLLESFCDHYLLHYADEWELNTALRVLRQMVGELDTPIVRILTRSVCSSGMTIHYKRDVIFILSQMVNCTPVRVYQRIMHQTDVDIKTSMANDLLIHVHLVMCLEKAFQLVKLCLKISSHRSKRIRESLLDGFITFDRKFSDRRSRIYEYCLNKLRHPHHKVLLYLGLTVASPKRAASYTDSVPAWGNASALARWYLRDYEEIREE